MSRTKEKLVAATVLIALLLLPAVASPRLGGEVKNILIFCILAMGLNVVVGYAGLLQLGIAAFFGIGAYITGILTVTQFPFQWNFWPAMVVATLGSAVAGMILAAPTLRLRGDYLAIVTLGFGEVVKFAIKNLENITNGSRALNPIPAPDSLLDWNGNYRWYYYLALLVVVLVTLLLRRLEDSYLGRAWFAIREDELAATCMGLNAAKVKLSAFAFGAALAGLAGSLNAASLNQTGGPDSYTFNRSITVLCFLIIGGMGNLRGAIAGTFLLMGYDNILTPFLDEFAQKTHLFRVISPDPSQELKFSDFKLVIFGLALILVMRFRPEGFFPSRRAEEDAA
ncbi:MAG TPA: branched-chain amino acid ABC transporter permease [Planctomycetota bacterium]|jgi:branched-chain amino acid transport system permease protein|nr:branched-chain amino acid ABC transporter permease [Planctomycetota bacterium]